MIVDSVPRIHRRCEWCRWDFVMLDRRDVVERWESEHNHEGGENE